ncbi:MAG: hypothetical protein QNJ98_02600 [Planctomycetota bacterium]|nr:hypothetical protein [Planctomycetota bacterium]
MSRVGALIRVANDELGVAPEHDLADVMQRVSDLLGDLVVADFDPEQLGSLVRKGLRPVRISAPSDRMDAVEIGCAFRDPLTEQEMIVLSLPTDVEDELVPVADPLHEELAGEALEAFLCGADGRPTRPLFANVDEVTGFGVRLHVPREAREGLLPARPTVSNVLGNVTLRYGKRPTLVLMRGGRPVWAVASKLAEAVVNRRTERIHLELRFTEPPDEGICARLGLAGTRDMGRAEPPESEAGPEAQAAQDEDGSVADPQ